MKLPGPKSRRGAPSTVSAPNSDKSETLAEARRQIKKQIFSELCARFQSSDFEERVRRADADALRKGQSK